MALDGFKALPLRDDGRRQVPRQTLNLLQNNVFRHPSQARLQGDQLGLLAYDLDVELVALLLQLSDLLAVFVFVDEALRELVLGFVSGSKGLQQRGNGGERQNDADKRKQPFYS